MGKEALRRPFQLLPMFRPRVWGREELTPFFAVSPGKDRIGEVWFTFEENTTSIGKSLGDLIRSHPEVLGRAGDAAHPGICPLLVKLLFTSERLSVQVHPDDDYAMQHHGSLGKTEAWYVLDAQPPGEIAVGFQRSITPTELKRAAESGEIENLLDWRRVGAGDVIFTPAGTVHAIGPGLTICEIQENSDITYRLYDYGRPRELHLDHGIAVSRLRPHDYKSSPIPIASGRDELLACEYFRIERLRPHTRMSFAAHSPYYLILICTKGSGEIEGEPFAAGQCWMIPARNEAVKLDGNGSEWILTYKSETPATGINSA
jgi:mannose-6-phosphate isomerase